MSSFRASDAKRIAMALTTMSPGHKQYFLTYLAQGLGRVGKEYLKTSAAAVLVNLRQMQIFSSLASSLDGKNGMMLLVATALVIAPFALKAPLLPEKTKRETSSLSALVLKRDAALVLILGFAVCLAPPCDVFLYRQHVLGLQGFQQPIISIAGTVGWFLCTLIYRKLSAGRCATDALRLCLKLWILPLFFKILILRPPELLILPAALLENAANEFGKALTFLPVTVLQQLHAPAGCEGSAFTLMQAGGTVGVVLGRNFEWQLLHWCGVEMQLGAAGFANFPVLLMIAAAWRVLTATALYFFLLPRLDGKSEEKETPWRLNFLMLDMA
eukprot:Skav221127  [mRNA]  locus=scaffold233:559578:562967:- [translate_table: standard]